MRQFLHGVVAVAALASVAPGLAAPGPLSQVSVDVLEDDQPVRDVLRRLEERHGLNYVVSEQVLARAGTVTVRLKQVPLDIALEAICSAAGLACEVRGPVITILPKAPGTGPALPRVDEGLVPDSSPPRDLTTDAGPPPPLAPDDLTAVGRLEEVDLDNRRMQLRIDGTKIDFYLPASGTGDAFQAMRLESAISTLKPGARVALLYRRDGNRSVVTALIGGTRPPRTARARPAKPEPAPAEKPVEQARTDLRQADAGGPTAPEVPAADEANAVGVPMPEGTLIGRLVGREGDVVRVRRGDGEVIALEVPPAATDSERHDRVLAAIDAMEPEGQIVVVYETVGDKKVIVGTITATR